MTIMKFEMKLLENRIVLSSVRLEINLLNLNSSSKVGILNLIWVMIKE